MSVPSLMKQNFHSQPSAEALPKVNPMAAVGLHFIATIGSRMKRAAL